LSFRASFNDYAWNSPSDFTCNLNQDLDLNENYKVALGEIFIKGKMNNLFAEWTNFSIKQAGKPEIIMTINEGNYVSSAKVIENINTTLKTYIKTKHLSLKEDKSFITLVSKKDDDKSNLSIIFNKRIQVLLGISSLKLNNKYRMKPKVNQFSSMDNCYLLSTDIAQNSYLGRHENSCLRLLFFDKSKSGNITYHTIFNKPYYFDTVPSPINKIRIMIKGPKGENLNLGKDSDLFVTLIFKKFE